MSTSQRPLSNRFDEAIEWLENGGKGESIATAARTCGITEHLQIQALCTKIRRRKKAQARSTPVKQGAPPLLTKEERLTVVQYIRDQASRSSIGATKDMLRNAINCLRRAKGKHKVSKSWFTTWVKPQPELHTIKSKPITRNRVAMHLLEDLRKWFDDEYTVALRETGIMDLPKHEAATRIHNIDEKGARLACPGGQQVVVPVEVEEIYIGIPENRLSVTVIETIRADGTTPTPSYFNTWIYPTVLTMLRYNVIHFFTVVVL